MPRGPSRAPQWRQRFSAKSEQVASAALVCLVFAGPVSRALFNLSALVLVVAWLLAGRYRERLASAWTNPIAAPALVLFGVILVGMLLSQAPWHLKWEHFRVYCKLPFLLVMISLLQSPQWRERAWAAFFLAMGLTLASTYLNVFLSLPWSRTSNDGLGQDHSVFVDYIVQGVISSVFVGVALQKLKEAPAPRLRWLWGGLALVTAFSIFFLLMGRTGPLTLASVLVVYGYLLLPPQRRWLGVLCVPVVLALLVYASPLLRARVVLGYSEFLTATSADPQSSIGIRWQTGQVALRMFLDSPLWGQGTGAYHVFAARHFGHCDATCFHPHNQYLFFAAEHGVIGLLAYGYLLFAIFRVARQAAGQGNFSMMAFFAVLVVDGLFNAPLWYRMESYFFYPMIALFMAEWGSRWAPRVPRGLPASAATSPSARNPLP